MVARYTQPSDMEPLFPQGANPELVERASLINSKAGELCGHFPPQTQKAIAALVRSMNGYYSNLIEGHRTRPADMEAALKHNFSTEPKQRELQLLHYAHLETQVALESRLARDPGMDFHSAEFICWIHEKFYSLLPESLKPPDEVVAGAIRTHNVQVGRHLPPPPDAVLKFLNRFQLFYRDYAAGPTPENIIAAMAAHHRLAWIHPFDDGNGRVARLHTHGWLVRLGVGGGGLWTLSRGLARNLGQYRQVLAAADQKRVNDYDGRGYLSQRHLVEFCTFMLDQALDQIQFMLSLLSLHRFENRLLAYCAVAEQGGELPKNSGRLLRDVILRGEITRGECSIILNVSARTAQGVIQKLLAWELLASPSPKGPLTIGFPGFICPFLFPDLYPAGN